MRYHNNTNKIHRLRLRTGLSALVEKWRYVAVRSAGYEKKKEGYTPPKSVKTDSYNVTSVVSRKGAFEVVDTNGPEVIIRQGNSVISVPRLAAEIILAED